MRTRTISIPSAPRRRHALSPREREVLGRRVDGDAVKVVAADLGLSLGSVSELQRRALDKLGVDSIEEAVRLVSNIAALFRHGPDGFAPMLTPDDVRELRDASAAITRGVGAIVAVLDRMEAPDDEAR